MTLTKKFLLASVSMVSLSVIFTTWYQTRRFVAEQQIYVYDFHDNTTHFVLKDFHDTMEDKWAKYFSDKHKQPLKGSRYEGSSRWALYFENESVVWVGRYEGKYGEKYVRAPFISFLDDSTVGSRALVQLVKKNRQVMYSSNSGMTMYGAQLFHSESLDLGLQQTKVYETHGGERYLGSVIPLNLDPPLSLVVTRPLAEVEAFARSIWLDNLGIMVVLLLVSSALILLLTSNLVKPLNELVNAIRRAGKGDFSGKLPAHRSDEVGMLAREFNDLGENLERVTQELKRTERMAVMGQFSAAIAHEIKNPLGGILVNSELLKELDESNKFSSPIGYIEKETRRAQKIVSGLMKFARQSPTPTVGVSLGAILEDTKSQMEPIVKSKGMELVVSAPEDLKATVHSEELQEVLGNLVSNAMDSMEESPGSKTVELNLHRQGDECVIVVKDHGKGFDEEEAERAFEPFYTSKAIGKGTGLGLAISHGIVTQSGGSISVKNHESGAMVEIRFPIWNTPTSS